MDMKKRCENLRDSYKAIEIEQLKLDNFKFEPESFEEDIVTGSDSEFPYAKHHFKIRGYGNIEYPRKRQHIREKIAKVRNEILEVENYIQSIEDPEMRNILIMYYELGMSQEQIAKQCGYDRSTISKKIKDYWSREQLSHNSHF